MKYGKRIGLAVALGVALGAGATGVVEPRLPAYPRLTGIRVGGETVPPGAVLRQWLARRSTSLGHRSVVLEHDGELVRTTRSEIGVRIDVGATMQAVRAAGHQGSLFKRLRQTAAARRGQLDVALAWRLDDAVTRAFIGRFAQEIARQPVDARFDLRGHRRVADVPGRELDLVATVAAVAAGYRQDQPIAMVIRPVAAKVRRADLDNIDISRVLSSFETRFRVYKKGRSFNVGRATDLLNGAVIRPRATLSFNERVGPRTPGRGFKPAPEIVGDELSVGIGGGTCQVSSTLYGASIYGGMTIVHRKSHSRPSSYTKLGLDATVSYPSVDLEISNPYLFSVVVHAFLPEPGLLRVELLGGEAVDKVEYHYGVSHVEPYVRRITPKSWLKAGKAFRKQKGTRGMDVHSFVTILYRDGHVDKRQYFSGYRASPEVYWVSPSTDPESLPPLPAHAKGVEGELRADGSDVYPTPG